MPSTRMMTRPAWNADSYSQLLMTAMLATTTAKKLFRPMPGAITKGLLAMKAMQMVPMAEAMQVARNTPFHSGGADCEVGQQVGVQGDDVRPSS